MDDKLVEIISSVIDEMIDNQEKFYIWDLEETDNNEISLGEFLETSSPYSQDTWETDSEKLVSVHR